MAQVDTGKKFKVWNITLPEIQTSVIYCIISKTCFMTCYYGTLKVIGSAGRKIHKKKTNDSHISITVYRTGFGFQ